MAGARTPIRNGFLQNDMDAAGHKILNLDLSDLASGVPFLDSVGLVRGSVDATKLLRFEVDGFTTATTRVLTPPNYNGTIATLAGVEDLTNKSLNGLTFSGTGGFVLDDASVSLQGTIILGTSDTDDIRIGSAGGTSNVTLPASGVLATVATTQPLSATLTTLALLTPTGVGKNLLTLVNAVDPAYLKVWDDIDNSVTKVLPADVLIDIGGMPLAYLSTDSGMKPLSDALVPSQKAVYSFVRGRIGGGPSPDSDDTVASATTLVLTGTGNQVDVTGVTPILAITLADGESRVLRFTGSLVLTHGATLLLPNGEDITTAAGGYAIVEGGPAGVVTVKSYVPDGFSVHYGGDFYTGGSFFSSSDIYIVGPFNTGGTFITSSTFTASGAFVTNGSFSVTSDFTIDGGPATLRTQLGTDATLPAGTTTLASLAGAETLSNKALTGVTALGILSPGAFDMQISHIGTLTANRLLRFNLNDALRTVSLTGNLTLAGNFVTAGAFATTLTTTATTALTLPTTGTLVAHVAAPASAGAAGIAGQTAWDADFLYQCTATNTWKRAAIATW